MLRVPRRGLPPTLRAWDLISSVSRSVFLTIDTRLRRSLSRSHGVVDPVVRDNLTRLKQLEDEVDATLRETIDAGEDS